MVVNPKSANPVGSVKHSFPKTQTEEWLANELLLLHDAESGNVPLRQFKCSNCSCINTYFADHHRAEEILSSGRRMMHRPSCRNRGCYCHTGLGPPKTIATRIVDWGDIPF